MSVKSRGLGKGLGVLLKGTSTDEAVKSGEICEIPINEIFPNPLQPRKTFVEESLQELAQSIQTQGILQPILVRPRPKKISGYEIVAGERRWRASQRTNLTTIPALIRNINDQETLAIALIENLQREDLNPIEEAQGLLRVKEALGLSQEKLAERVGKSRSAVANSMRLMQLPEKIQTDLQEKKITSGHARSYLALPGMEERLKIHTQVMSRQLNVRQTEKLVRAMLAPSSTPATTQHAGNATKIFCKECKTNLEKVMGRREGLSFRVKGNEEQGTISLVYATSEERERVLRIMQQGVSQTTDGE